MKISSVLLAGAVASFVCIGAVLAQGSGKSFSVETSSIGELLRDPQAKAIFEKHFPQVVTDKRLANAQEQTLPEIKVMAGGVITGLTVWCVGFGKYGIHTPLGPQLLTAVYTAIVAWPSLWVLTRMRRVFRFKTSVGR